MSKAIGILITPGDGIHWRGLQGEGLRPFIRERPSSDEVSVIEWPDIGLVIPWPEGMSASEAVQVWRRAAS